MVHFARPTGASRSCRTSRRRVNHPPTPPQLSFREVTAETWPAFEKLFGSRGGPKSCWCMVWRASVEEARNTDGRSRKSAMSSRIMNGTPVGIWGYLEEDPVAWCSVAPRSTHRLLVSDRSSDDGVWSITCFFVTRELRGSAIAKQLLAAAISHAKKCGAKVVEAYPVDPDSPSYRFMGFVPMFSEAGFVPIGHEGKRRKIMRTAPQPE